ncbi:flagellar hook assembly protein FlgD [Thermicanus aegyptius]|uniref:flagellar hook assembly protein FlgD n=1 Tax=Thermicanus aegyptius TaxID=94009 RepID=UPI00034975D5|nr:flagellar hook capping FlgD N-terminal domain-containing protein [Thermicanus aegyptius]
MDNTIRSSSVIGTAGTNQGSTNPEGRNTLGQDAFLQILVAQLKYQDPLQPMQDRDFIAQMATFSSVQQLIQLNQAVAEIKEMLKGTSPAQGG